MATVELKNIGKTYESTRAPEGVRAVRGVDIAVRDGEFVVLVGPSGCGKSTLLRMIAGLESITEGSLAIDGRTVNDIPARDRDIAMVFQNYALYPHLSVRANMAFGLHRRRQYPSRMRAMVSPTYRAARTAESRRIDDDVQAAAETLDLVPLLDRLPRELSGGQRQRVAVGRAIVRNPKVFLFDEPLSNLDAKLRVELRIELRQLHRQLKATMIYVTHDQEEAMGLGDRLVVLRDGAVQQNATPTEVYTRPANRFVATFIGMPSMNCVDGRLHRSDAGERFAAEDFVVELPRGKGAGATPGPITFGIRPDRVHVGAAAHSCAWRSEAIVEAVERLGDRADIALRVGAHRLLARSLPEHAPAEGESTAIGFDPRDGHLFADCGDAARIG
ncbi:MAG: ATP-binding cassette domain-containing protein [Phycisphaerae bacterium]|nr:ATP-binding cassette domain-containing protein [Phycisphaerae bacterium]